MAVSAPPKRNKDAASTGAVPAASEKKIESIINRGSSTVAISESPAENDPLKTVTVKLLSSTLKVIDSLREKRPRKPTSPKLGISQVDWITEAIEEKIKREKKHYNVD
ncbi:hypothetical protein [Dyadobacter sp. 50-39]|uniref:hypothetical protein n=1 Tax=Dyadobacter sp. 50-39 TaxID=1895756 RepID=UPI00095FFADF|nr:hypothetical protein [Dyadobacter sp. 50-39]OJV22428.1 MAG: hypothetical protein BGO21_30185 [Dyadobacter sp. 50-39]